MFQSKYIPVLAVMLAAMVTFTMATRYFNNDDEADLADGLQQLVARDLLDLMIKKRNVCLYITWWYSEINHIQIAQKCTIVEQLVINVYLSRDFDHGMNSVLFQRTKHITEDTRPEIFICHVNSITVTTTCLCGEMRQ